jgi:hypothetical protein
MSSLADFVSENRSKTTTVFSGVRDSFTNGSFSSKMSNSISGIFSRGGGDDQELLVDSASTSGQLPTSRNRKTGGWFTFGEDANVCGLSRMQRIITFFLFLAMAAFCFVSAMMLIPILILSTRKFAMLNTLGSLFFLVSFVFLWGPKPYALYLFSETKRLVTGTYTLSVLLTLYTSIWLHSTIFTAICAVFQAAALIWFVFSFVPGGERGLRFLTGLCTGVVTRQSKLVLPI